jgi:hypothetical protein
VCISHREDRDTICLAVYNHSATIVGGQGDGSRMTWCCKCGSHSRPWMEYGKRRGNGYDPQDLSAARRFVFYRPVGRPTMGFLVLRQCYSPFSNHITQSHDFTCDLAMPTFVECRPTTLGPSKIVQLNQTARLSPVTVSASVSFFCACSGIAVQRAQISRAAFVLVRVGNSNLVRLTSANKRGHNTTQSEMRDGRQASRPGRLRYVTYVRTRDSHPQCSCIV